MLCLWKNILKNIEIDVLSNTSPKYCIIGKHCKFKTLHHLKKTEHRPALAASCLLSLNLAPLFCERASEEEKSNDFVENTKRHIIGTIDQRLQGFQPCCCLFRAKKWQPAILDRGWPTSSTQTWARSLLSCFRCCRWATSAMGRSIQWSLTGSASLILWFSNTDFTRRCRCSWNISWN